MGKHMEMRKSQMSPNVYLSLFACGILDFDGRLLPSDRPLFQTRADGEHAKGLHTGAGGKK